MNNAADGHIFSDTSVSRDTEFESNVVISYSWNGVDNNYYNDDHDNDVYARYIP